MFTPTVTLDEFYYKKMSKRKAPTPLFKPSLKRQRVGNYAFKKAVLRTRTDEEKNIDVVTNTTIVAGQATASLALLNGLDDGATSTTRIGRKVTLTSLQYRWVGSLAATSAGSSGLRMLIVYDKQANAAAPLATDVLQVNTIYSQMNLSNGKRFKVLVDELISCIGTQGPQSWCIKGYRKFEKPLKNKPGLEMTFNNASTNDITSIITGSVYALFLQDGNIITANPISNMYSRFRFIDA